MMTRENVEKMINEKFEQLENGKMIGDQRQKVLNLRLKSQNAMKKIEQNENSLFNSEVSQNNFSNDDQLRQEFVKEVKEMKESIKQSGLLNT